MKDKYYVPTIEELTYGLNIQYRKPLALTPIQAMTMKREYGELWHDRIIGGRLKDISAIIDDYFPDNFTHLKQYVDDKAIRIKCLDKEDIEDCGWKYNKAQSKNYSWDDYNLNDLTLTVYHDDNSIHINNGEGYEELESYFDGHIKNKSELKKVMDMLRITDKKDLL